MYSSQPTVMTPYTASLTYRVHLCNAANYAHFITETDRDILQRWGDIYKTGDIKKWADERIANILKECAALWPLFSDDRDIVSSVQTAARGWCEVLGLEVLPGNVQSVDTVRIE